MGIIIEIWNALWDNQILIAVLLVLLVWIVVRGFDVVRWFMRKVRKRATPAAPDTTPKQ